MNPKNKPRFLRQSATYLKRLGNKWRRPKGNQSKLRMHKKHKGFLPNPGYGADKDLRGLHPSGLKEVLVHNINELNSLNSSVAARIAAGVGRKKRMEIMRVAKEKSIKILNPVRENKSEV